MLLAFMDELKGGRLATEDIESFRSKDGERVVPVLYSSRFTYIPGDRSLVGKPPSVNRSLDHDLE
jgi:hypothetical protein